ncbi:MAG: CDP-diacylglycerol--serine O-phosphatidyltransferase [Bacteroidaceae bacterium]|nr:CDP-diacylglycerol--serine O-phosphatidyltransferase [Bacteroidaceae bacterium]
MSFKKHIPNAITCCNLLSGCMSCVMAMEGNFVLAFTFIVLGAVFDFFDGMVARLLGVSSPLGIQIDSLADDITFGFTPSFMVFTYMQGLTLPDYLAPVAGIIPYTPFLIAAFSALRLAKFNIDKRQTTTFIGLPTPANALFWASLVVGYGNFIYQLNYGWLLMLGLIALSCYLLIAEIPMFSMKIKYFAWRANKIRYSFLLVSAPMLLLGFGAAVPIISLYVAISVVKTLAKKR